MPPLFSQHLRALAPLMATTPKQCPEIGPCTDCRVSGVLGLYSPLAKLVNLFLPVLRYALTQHAEVWHHLSHDSGLYVSP